jgi:NAD(P)-dependent dehydrogenase (short-subunit alcohol dehydrogenase family)
MANFDLSGKTALVTGASSGLGRNFAKTLSRSGANVVLAARRVEQLQVLREEIESGGGRAELVRMDVTSDASIEAAFEKSWQIMGPISIIVNNAGVAATKRMLDKDEGDWRRVFDTNLIGAANVARAAAQRLVDAKFSGGSIINIASILGLQGALGVAIYAASKAALLSLTKSLALEWGRKGIRVNAIAPGYVKTSLSKEFFDRRSEKLLHQIPLKKFIDPSDLDGPLLLLASEASSWMTGSTLVVDAGHSLVFEASA